MTQIEISTTNKVLPMILVSMLLAVNAPIQEKIAQERKVNLYF